MKNYILSILICLGIFVLTFLQHNENIDAATITKGYTFATNELVTSTKLHTLVDAATLSAIVSADITDGTIVNADMANNSIASANIVDGTIVAADIASRTITSGLIVTNAITDVELNTNLTTRAGLWDLTLTRFTANSITNTAVLGTTTGGSASDSGKIVKLDSNGKIDNTMLSQPAVLTTNRLSATSGTANTWTAIGSLTTTITNGGVVVTGRAVPPVGGASIYYVRVRASDYSISSQAEIVGAGDTTARALSVSMVDSLTTTSTKQYILEIADGNGSQTWTANAATGVAGTDSVTNHMGMTILQQGR